jgi:ATP-dependent Clp protease ATP-binding subunit ClpB
MTNKFPDPAAAERLDRLVKAALNAGADAADAVEFKNISVGVSYRLGKLEIRLDVDESALQAVAKEGFDPVYGARPLKRAIQQEIENPLAKEILAGAFAAGDTIHVREKGGKIVFGK